MKQTATTTTIGALAKNAGVGIETVRFYERKGLLPKPARLDSGYRFYTEQDAKRIRFIKRAQELGFTLREVKELLGLRVNAKAKCEHVKERTDHKIVEIDGKIKDLRRMLRSLKVLSEACGCGSASTTECPILDCFETGGRCK
jgi:Hg(II)-responsive transcriptional regulator